MSIRNTVLAFGAGIVVGYIAKQQMDKYQETTPEAVLERVKDTFRKSGPISGSWIYMKPEQIEKNSLTYTVYRGGITRNIDGENKQFEFYADVKTGMVIDAIQTNI